MRIKNIYIFSILLLILIYPKSSFAQEISTLEYLSTPFCSDFTKNLKVGMNDVKDFQSNPEIQNLQYALIREGFFIPQANFGSYEINTYLAVVEFQNKYKNELFNTSNFKRADGQAGPITRKKLASLYGCTVKISEFQNDKNNKTILTIKGVSFAENGISVTFCNLSNEDKPAFPVRIRVNGILREFDITQAHNKNTCHPLLLPYEIWGLDYDPEIIYSAIISIDPFGYYKEGRLSYSGIGNVNIPAVEGIQIGVRGLMFKNDSLQGTFCNLGTRDILKFPVTIYLNGISKDFDIIELYKSGKCHVKTWRFNDLGINYIPGEKYTAVIITGKDFGYDISKIKDEYQFSNAGIISGKL